MFTGISYFVNRIQYRDILKDSLRDIIAFVTIITVTIVAVDARAV
jgi:hypothetical protein